MAKHVWEMTIPREGNSPMKHVVEVDHGFSKHRRTIILDGRRLGEDESKLSGLYEFGTDDRFTIDGHECVVQNRCGQKKIQIRHVRRPRFGYKRNSPRRPGRMVAATPRLSSATDMYLSSVGGTGLSQSSRISNSPTVTEFLLPSRFPSVLSSLVWF